MSKKKITEEVIAQMRALEAEGKSRKEIADQFGVHPSAITRRLGAVRSYRGARLPQ